jgi:protein N-terminal amidase
MDLNPHPPNTDDDPFSVCELAEFAIQKNARILVVLCAWLHSGLSPDLQWDTVSIDYWSERVRPLWERPATSVGHAGQFPHQLASGPDATRETSETVEDRETIVVISNRTGMERGE